MSDRNDAFESIDPTALTNVSGGAARVTSRASSSSTELTTMLTQIGNSIKDLAASKNSGSDPTQLMLMMMMLGGGFGGGGAAAPAPAPVPDPTPVINVNTRVGGRKGW